jgi:hypothetical protein
MRRHDGPLLIGHGDHEIGPRWDQPEEEIAHGISDETSAIRTLYEEQLERNVKFPQSSPLPVSRTPAAG